MRADIMGSILAELNDSSADIEASAVISGDGLTLAAVSEKSLDQDKVGAMSAAMLSLGERTAQELARGELEQLMIKGKSGYVLMTHAGPDTVVTVLARPKAKLGLIFLDVKRFTENISRALQ
ncbi:MAG: roadblock/LC7 domain-containing protein [Gammaproteobacteria bacterium]|nr:roadblock/LC7 domain-containing protein [Gammaproteobacteria bacterium]MDH5800125.1 roadblock/LC7 domain-containing protein [Gammaproteobacteria bacterium]